MLSDMNEDGWLDLIVAYYAAGKYPCLRETVPLLVPKSICWTEGFHRYDLFECC